MRLRLLSTYTTSKHEQYGIRNTTPLGSPSVLTAGASTDHVIPNPDAKVQKYGPMTNSYSNPPFLASPRVFRGGNNGKRAPSGKRAACTLTSRSDFCLRTPVCRTRGRRWPVSSRRLAPANPTASQGHSRPTAPAESGTGSARFAPRSASSVTSSCGCPGKG